MAFHFKDRVFEWWLAFNTLLYGFFLALPGESMDGDAYINLREWLSEVGWSGFFVLTGVVHLTALTVNGRAWWTPFLRSAATSANALIYALLGFGFWLVDPISTAVFAYSVFIFSAAVVCFYRATKDASAVWEALHAEP